MTDFGCPPEYTVGHGLTETIKVDFDKQAITVTPSLPALLPTEQWQFVRYKAPLTIKPSNHDLYKMPFLPIEQLPEAWKDGRPVLMEEVHDDGKSYAVCYYGGDGWYVTYGLRLFTPTHFCPIPLE